MINEIFVFLKNSLNSYMSSGATDILAQEDQVSFLNGQSVDALGFKLNSISLLLINMEQENVLNPPNTYERTFKDGSVKKVNPEIRLNLYVLFVAHYQQYEDSLRNLSSIIQFFQNHRVFTHQNSPQLSENIEQLIVELKTLSVSEQNEVWGSLRLPYHPSVMYKVRMAIFRDETAQTMPEITEISIKVS